MNSKRHCIVVSILGIHPRAALRVAALVKALLVSLLWRMCERTLIVVNRDDRGNVSPYGDGNTLEMGVNFQLGNEKELELT